MSPPTSPPLLCFPMLLFSCPVWSVITVSLVTSKCAILQNEWVGSFTRSSSTDRVGWFVVGKSLHSSQVVSTFNGMVTHYGWPVAETSVTSPFSDAGRPQGDENLALLKLHLLRFQKFPPFLFMISILSRRINRLGEKAWSGALPLRYLSTQS